MPPWVSSRASFGVQVTDEAARMADEVGVKIFTADIIYHLFDKFTAYMGDIREELKKVRRSQVAAGTRAGFMPSRGGERERERERVARASPAWARVSGVWVVTPRPNQAGASVPEAILSSWVCFPSNPRPERNTCGAAQAAAERAVFPCRLKIMRECIFCRKDPIVLGVQVMEGIARVGTPIAIPSQNFITIGKIASMEVRAPASDPCPWLGSGLVKRQGLPNMGVL